MQNVKYYWRYWLGLVFAIAIFWSAHQVVFQWVIRKNIQHLKEKRHITVSYKGFRTKGLAGCVFQGITVTNATTDTLFEADSMEIRVKVLPLLVGKVYFSKVAIKQASVHISPQLIGTFTQKSGQSTPSHAEAYSPLPQRLNKWIRMIPSWLTIDSLAINYIDPKGPILTTIRQLYYRSKQLHGIVSVAGTNERVDYLLEGKIFPRQQKVNITVQSGNEGKNPWLQQKWGLDFTFREVEFEYRGLNANSAVISVSAGKVKLFHSRVAEQPVYFDTTSISLLFRSDRKYWQIDSVSQIAFNGFHIPLFIRYEKDSVNPVLAFAIPRTVFSAQQFFDALPSGAFKRLYGIKTTGNLIFWLKGRIPFGEIDSLQLNSKLQPENFRIKQYGMANLAILNDTFTVYRHEPGMSPVAIKVDTLSKNYTRLPEISKYLIYAVLTSEDGSFFYHKGFNEEAFARSLAENIRKKRFARGASTITMQLVRNVFLSRNKTLARKFEEILLTWMLENTHIVSKERMLEIYFNIIEWGPNVYGVKQAARFYFNKKPSQLTLQESIFLASIVPSPKYFRYTFAQNGAMKDCFEGYFQRIAQIMLARNQILPSDTVGLNHRVTLTGEAQKFLTTLSDSLVNANDSTFFDPDANFNEF